MMSDQVNLHCAWVDLTLRVQVQHGKDSHATTVTKLFAKIIWFLLWASWIRNLACYDVWEPLKEFKSLYWYNTSTPTPIIIICALYPQFWASSFNSWSFFLNGCFKCGLKADSQLYEGGFPWILMPSDNIWSEVSCSKLQRCMLLVRHEHESVDCRPACALQCKKLSKDCIHAIGYESQ